MNPYRFLALICIPLIVMSCTTWIGKTAPRTAAKIPPVTGTKAPEERPLQTMTAGRENGGIDDLDLKSLETAIDRSLQYYDKIKETSLRYGDRDIPIATLKASLLAFREILRDKNSIEAKMNRIEETFDFIPPTGRDEPPRVIFTGYYIPILEGSEFKTARYRYPLYRKPDDLIVVNLRKFDGKYRSEQVLGRLDQGELIPYHTRDDIDRKGALGNRRLELLWVDDPIALYSLHVQGSGKIRMPGGRTVVVSYASSNGWPFRSISTRLVEKEQLTAQEISYPRVQQYLKENPNELSDLFSYNDRYIFFRRVEREPLGSLQVPVTSGRTIATDPDVYPRGALALIKTQKPLFNTDGQIRQWVPFTRFVLNQDAGAAIKGPGRVDIFCGDGPNAEQLAGSFKEKGEIYILLIKE
jgi:membrane-bound lytic murein transglycosylase A